VRTIRVHCVPVGEDNYSYIVLHESAPSHALVVDPGLAGPVLETLKSLGASVGTILITHHHMDHVAGVEELYVSAFHPRVVTYLSEMDRVPRANTAVDDEDVLEFGPFVVKALHVPGHTRGDVAYLIGDNLFTGDTLFLGGCGRLFEGRAEDLFHSLYGKLRGLGEETRIYPGHEYTVRTRSFCLSVDPVNGLLREKLEEARSLRARGLPTVPGDLGTEKKTNVFLRCDTEEVIDRVRDRCPQLRADPISVFKELRKMMDTF